MTDKNLTFLISLPRSGSTLTQKIIGSHKDVYTRSEPWIMFNPLYSLKKEGISAEYNKATEYAATQDFISNLPGGRKHYIEKLRSTYLSLYHDYLDGNNKNMFLDKTPRYYLIINELQEIFPNAKFILLVRNPLAVLSSIINTWTKENYQKLYNSKVDLIDGLNIILNQLSEHQNNLYILRYEDILSNPINTIDECFRYLELGFDSSVLNYYQENNDERWLLGDPENVYKKKGIDKTNDLQWINSLDTPQHWRLIHDYLKYIGKKRFELLGYDFEKFNNILLEKLPATNVPELEENTISLFSFFESSSEKTLKEAQKEVNLLKDKNKDLIKSSEKTLKEAQKEVNLLKDKNKDLTKSIDKIKSSKIYRLANILLKPFQGI